jgi:hypothetical protein
MPQSYINPNAPNTDLGWMLAAAGVQRDVVRIVESLQHENTQLRDAIKEALREYDAGMPDYWPAFIDTFEELVGDE